MVETAVCPRSFARVKLGTIISVITTFATMLFTVGILYGQIRTNTKELDKREAKIESIDVVQSDVNTIKTDVATIKGDIKTLLINSK